MTLSELYMCLVLHHQWSKKFKYSIQIQLLLEKDVNLEYAVNVCCSNPIASGKIDSAM